jgi:hypothetical protein
MKANRNSAIVTGNATRVVVESRRKKFATIEKLWPGALIVDVTSKGAEPWVRFSPFFPHGGIPIPNSSGVFAESVEGHWQGLKVFEREDVDPHKWAITTMSGIKRSGKSRGAVRGHRYGVGSNVLLGFRFTCRPTNGCWRIDRRRSLKRCDGTCRRRLWYFSITRRTVMLKICPDRCPMRR